MDIDTIYEQLLQSFEDKYDDDFRFGKFIRENFYDKQDLFEVNEFASERSDAIKEVFDLLYDYDCELLQSDPQKCAARYVRNKMIGTIDLCWG